MRTGITSLRRLVQFTIVMVMAFSAPVALAQGPVSVSKLAQDLSDAVVNIGTTRTIGRGLPFPEAPEGSPLEQFLEDRNPNRGLGEEALREARSLGSGFIIEASGLIVTNNHVIEEADEIIVFLTDGTRLEAELVGADDKTDLAVLRVHADRDLPFVSFGDSDAAEVGDWVMAIGNPFGLGGSVTLGIVSARNRNINSGPYDSFIQTDAAINQGNSGGPLFDMDGNVVGINTAIISRGGGGLGIGFAVPGNLAWPVIEQLIEFGETRRGWLGVGIQEVTADISDSLGRDNTIGAMVVDVTPTGPSDGVIKQGDVILEFDGKEVTLMRDLPKLVAATQVGKEIDVLVLRNGVEQTLTITLGRLEQGELIIAENRNSLPRPELLSEDELMPVSLSALIGFDAETLSEDVAANYEIAADASGVVITDIVRDSDAEDKGLVIGMVIEEVNQQKLVDVEQLSDMIVAARESGRAAVLFKLADPAGNRRYIAVRLN